MSFDPAIIAQARIEIANAPHGMKSEIADRWAALLNTTMQTLYRHINPDVNSRRTRKGQPQKPEYQDWARIVFQVKNMPPEEAGVLSTEDAVASAIKHGLLPSAALEVPVGTYNRIARENGWHKREKRRNRIQAERPNQTHHFDGSSSPFFHIARRYGDGDYLMKMHRPAAGGYKNKPIPVDRLRPYYYGLADDHSGRLISQCYPLVGEDSGSAMQFLDRAWKEIGLCEELAADEGMIKKCFASRNWIDRLGVSLPDSMPYEKEAHGKIERPWRTLWKKFELTFYAASNDWKNFEIALSEFNRQLMNFIEDKYNQLPHRFEKGITKMQAWSRINLYGGIVRMPDDALAAVAKWQRRKVDVSGKFEYCGSPYEVIGLHDAWVWVYEGVFADRLIVQDCETGIKYEVRDFKPLSRGEFRSHPETPHQKLVKESGSLALSGAGLYSDKAPQNEKVVSMPIRTKEEREIEDPFDVTTYANIEEAMSAFFAITGLIPITPEERRDVEILIKQHGLNKAFVEEIALDIRAMCERKRAAAGG